MTSALPRPRRFGLGRRAEPYGFLSPTALLLLVLMVIPIVMVIGYSFFDKVILAKNGTFIGIENYIEVLTDDVFHTAIANTLVFVTVSVVAHLILGLAFAMMLNSDILPRRVIAVFRGIYILPWLFTAAIVAVLWRMLLSPSGVVNFLLSTVGLATTDSEWLSNPALALGAVTFINIWSGYPFFMISLLAGLQGIPSDLYEAARVDGAGPIRQFVSVTLPGLKPILYSMALLDLLWTTQQFTLIWATTGGGPLGSTEMLSTYTYKLAFNSYQFSLASTSAVLVLAASLIVAVFYVRRQRKEERR